MSVRFTQLTSALPYPPEKRAQLSTLHGEVIAQAMTVFDGTYRTKRKIIEVMNSLSYMVLENDVIGLRKKTDDVLNSVEIVNDDLCRARLNRLFIVEKDILWDIDIVDQPAIKKPVEESQPVVAVVEVEPPVLKKPQSRFQTTPAVPTPKEDLYIRPPVVPQFDINQVYASAIIGGVRLCIYKSLPDIPTKQNQISCTTDVNKMTSQNLRALFPNRFIRTRALCMYEPQRGLELHPQLGLIIPVDGFTKDQLIDNLIKYPHIFQLKKCVGNTATSFYTTIEINGELRSISDVWSSLPESSKIPKNVDFLKEYVVRRYLLERDIKGVHHRYQICGTLDPYLTLFTTIEEYQSLGIKDIDELARQCVRARVSYKQSRNPVLRRIQENV